MDYQKVTGMLHKIYEYLQKTEISYRKTFPKDHDSVYDNDYAFKNFWIDYLKMNRKFFKKSEVYNTKSTIENESNSSNKLTEFKVITNELAIILEDNKFIENSLYLMVSVVILTVSRMSFYNVMRRLLSLR
jgi:hypothetical protein